MNSAATNCSATNGHTNLGKAFWILLLGFSSCTGCDFENSLLTDAAVSASAPMVLKVAVQAAEYSANADKTVVCFGMFQPAREASLTFSQGGMVQEIRAEPGQKVTEGQLLAALNQQPIVQQRQAAENAHQRALAELNQAAPAQRPQITARINGIEAQKNALDAELAKGQLRAPFAGMIARRNIQPGDFVSAQMTAFVLMEDGPPLVRVQLDQQTAAALDTNVRMWIGHNGTAIPAKIKQRSLLRGPVTGEQLLLELQEPLTVDDWAYAEVVEVRYRLSTPDSGYWLPLSAVHHSAGGSWSVLVAEQRRPKTSAFTEAETSSADQSAWVAVRRDCQVLRYADGQVLVTAPDLNQKLVITDGGHRLVAGQAIDPVLSSTARTNTTIQKDGP